MRRLLMTPLVLAALLLAGVAGAPPASALPEAVLCNAAGLVFVEILPDHSMNWDVSGSGRCATGDVRGPYLVTFTGTGTSTTDGFCQGGALTVNNLDIAVTAVLTSTHSTFSRTVTMHWIAPVTTYPNVTPFLVQGAGVLPGAGNIGSAGTACDGDLNSAGAFFDWTYLQRLL